MNTMRSGFVFVILVAAPSVALSGQEPMPHGATPSPAPPASIRITMDELHAQGGVPRGWTFQLPVGDARAGHKVFVDLECFACHEVKGESFPHPAKVARGAGPELTGMGAHHPAAYFAESILN